MFGLSEIAVLLIVVALVVGAKKLPELVRSAGKASRILKAESRAMKAGDEPGEPAATYTVKETRPADGGR
ncbi:twin-arginine translocase TatA/TatE family subunit [Streptomyces griseus]|uniref:twin-arginine translocase TatA/TatE family subunit n=1 Tax=Streptomyces griseus TaxID=1911 RepID=UPI00055D24C4|nr:twin-arginine translocase TatA/TatE family subunit [Streptomyces griseus]